MWDYDKLFAEGNILGIKNCYENFIFNQVIDFSEPTFWVECYKNNELSCKGQYVVNDKIKHSYTTDFKIQYIIRLDGHGNVVEKLFDREMDMKPEPEPMPELKDGMFIRVAFKNNYLDQNLGFVNLSQGRIIYQEGGFDWVDNIKTWKEAKIIEIYDPGTLSFHSCRYTTPIWRSTEYQTYLDSKN